MDSNIHCKFECTVRPPIEDTPKEDKPPNKGQAKSTPVYTLYRKSPLKLHKTAGPESVLVKWFHCMVYSMFHVRVGPLYICTYQHRIPL